MRAIGRYWLWGRRPCLPGRAQRPAPKQKAFIQFWLCLILALVTGCAPRLARYDDSPPVFMDGALPRDRLLAYMARRNPRLPKDQAEYIADGILRWSDARKLDPKLVAALIATESSYNPQATSSSGAMGLGQLMPPTAKDMGVENAYDVEQNLRGTTNYLAWLLSLWANHPHQRELALAAYSSGPGRVMRQVKSNERLDASQLRYVNRVLSHLQHL